MNSVKTINRAGLLEMVARLYVFFFLNVYGWGKMAGMQFYRRGKLPEEVALTTLGEASAYDLGWTFMGYSTAYIIFIGSAQIVGAWLLLWPRTKLLGVAVLLPILFNIIAFDLVFLDKKGALIAALLYTFLLLYVVWFNRRLVGEALRALTASAEPGFFRGQRWWLHAAAVVLVAGLLFALDQTLVGIAGR